MLYRGQVTLSVDRACRATSYKYLVVKRGEIIWEDLSEFAYSNSIVNRVLKIPEQYIRSGGKLGEASMLEPGARHFSVIFLQRSALI